MFLIMSKSNLCVIVSQAYIIVNGFCILCKNIHARFCRLIAPAPDAILLAARSFTPKGE